MELKLLEEFEECEVCTGSGEIPVHVSPGGLHRSTGMQTCPFCENGKIYHYDNAKKKTIMAGRLQRASYIIVSFLFGAGCLAYLLFTSALQRGPSLVFLILDLFFVVAITVMSVLTVWMVSVTIGTKSDEYNEAEEMLMHFEARKPKRKRKRR